jgi:hypothetical protein
VGVLLVVASVLFTVTGLRNDWQAHQSAFRRLVQSRFGVARAAEVAEGPQQIWVPALGRTDRCVTCHQATTWPGFETADQPSRTHPAEVLKAHPIERFGCTACHGGQGWALDREAAHGMVQHWPEPLLGKEMAAAYQLQDARAMM